MAGRGRGRGRGKGFSFDIQNLGFSRVDEVLQTQTSTAPPPLFPPLVAKTPPLRAGSDVDIRAGIFKKLLERKNEDPYGINVTNQVRGGKDIERYSEKFKPRPYDKYAWNTLLFPSQLFAEDVSGKGKRKSKAKSTTVSSKPHKKSKIAEQEVEKKLEGLEEKDDVAADQNKEEEKDSEQEGDEIDDDEDIDDEELLEESTDYISSYFDNGEGYLEEEDNLEEDAVF